MPALPYKSPRVETEFDRKEEDRKRLLEIWKRYRQEHPGATQTWLAASVGITKSAMSQYFRGVMGLNTDMILKIARALDIKPNEIRPDLQVSHFTYEEMLEVIRTFSPEKQAQLLGDLAREIQKLPSQAGGEEV